MAENGGRIQRQQGFMEALAVMGKALGITSGDYLGRITLVWLAWINRGIAGNKDVEKIACWCEPHRVGDFAWQSLAAGVLLRRANIHIDSKLDVSPEWDAALTKLYAEAVAIRRKATREAKEKRITRCEVHSSKLTPDSVEVMQIPIKGALRVAFVMSDFAEEMEEMYPEVDIQRELAKARQWCVSKPDRQKTRRGVRAFLVAWMDRAQESASKKKANDRWPE